MHFLWELFDVSSYLPRIDRHGWTHTLTWVHVIGDCLICLALVASAILILEFARRRKDLRLPWTVVLAGVLCMACGVIHFLEAVNFITPVNGITSYLKAVTGILSLVLVVGLGFVMPTVLAMRDPWELEQEIVARKGLEQSLVENAAILQARAELLDLAPEIILVRDMHGLITYWNLGAERFYGWKQSQALGHDKHKLLQTQFPRPYAQIEAELFQSDYCEVELEQTKADGTTVISESRWALQRDANGEPKAILEVSRDITQQKRAKTFAKKNDLVTQSEIQTHGIGELFIPEMNHCSRIREKQRDYQKALT
jgi:PAS domain S-box-containing protein